MSTDDIAVNNHHICVNKLSGCDQYVINLCPVMICIDDDDLPPASDDVTFYIRYFENLIKPGKHYETVGTVRVYRGDAITELSVFFNRICQSKAHYIVVTKSLFPIIKELNMSDCDKKKFVCTHQWKRETHDHDCGDPDAEPIYNIISFRGLDIK